MTILAAKFSIAAVFKCFQAVNVLKSAFVQWPRDLATRWCALKLAEAAGMLHPTGRFAARLGSFRVMTIHEHRKRSVPRSEQVCSLPFSATAAGQGEGHHCGRVMTCDGGHHCLPPSPPPLLRCCCCCWTSRDEKENCRHSLAGDCARGGALLGRHPLGEADIPGAVWAGRSR